MKVRCCGAASPAAPGLFRPGDARSPICRASDGRSPGPTRVTSPPSDASLSHLQGRLSQASRASLLSLTDYPRQDPGTPAGPWRWTSTFGGHHPAVTDFQQGLPFKDCCVLSRHILALSRWRALPQGSGRQRGGTGRTAG